jgi:hypothetical protein
VDELGSASRRPHPRLLQLLEAVFDQLHEEDRKNMAPLLYERRRHDFAFHMTDWLRDLESLGKLYQDPGQVSLEKATRFLIGFLYHVIPHLNAAGRLLLDEIPDAFAPAEKKK